MSIVQKITQKPVASLTSTDPVLCVSNTPAVMCQTTPATIVTVGLPTQTGNSGKYLTTDGTNVSWVSISQILPTQTGNSGKYLTTNGTIASWGAITGVLPTQTGNSGKYLTTDGAAASWGTITTALPSQTGNSGKILTTNGTSASWSTALGLGLPTLSANNRLLGNNTVLAQFATVAIDGFGDEIENANGRTWAGGTWVVSGNHTCNWITSGGTLSIDDPQFSGTSTDCFYMCDLGISDGVFTLIHSNLANDFTEGVAFRFTDYNNYWQFSIDEGDVYLRQIQSGTITLRDSAGGLPDIDTGSTPTLTVTCSGAGVTATLNCTRGGGTPSTTTLQYGSATFNQTTTKHGVFQNVGGGNYSQPIASFHARSLSPTILGPLSIDGMRTGGNIVDDGSVVAQIVILHPDTGDTIGHLNVLADSD